MLTAMVAIANPIEHIADKPWPGWQVHLFGMKITLMSSGIAVMILVAVALIAVILPAVRRRRTIPTGIHNVLETLVVFVRDMIAKPALNEKADSFLPYLITLFLFVLGMNLLGIVPLQPLTQWMSSWAPWMRGKPIGGTATSIPSVCAALAALALFTIMACGLWRAAKRKHEKDNWPMWICAAGSPLLWMRSLSPKVPGAVGVILAGPLALLEFVGAVTKCFSLMIRLAANMLAGHILLAILMMLTMQAAANAIEKHVLFFGASILCVIGSVAATMIDLLVAVLQAYIFTFLTAMFLGLYVEPSH